MIPDDFYPMLHDFKREAESDCIGLWQIIGALRDKYPEMSPDERRAVTLEFVSLLLSNGFEAGDPPYSAPGYRRWPDQTPDYVLARINREWDVLGREPDIPDIAWFGLTSH